MRAMERQSFAPASAEVTDPKPPGEQSNSSDINSAIDIRSWLKRSYMTLCSKTTPSEHSPCSETADQVSSDETRSSDAEENILRSTALDAEQLLQATSEGMPLDEPAHDAKDLQSALVQLEDINTFDETDASSSRDSGFKRIMVVTSFDHDMNRTVTEKACNMAEVTDGKVFLLGVVSSGVEATTLASAGPMVAAVPRVVVDETELIDDRSKQLEALRAEVGTRIEVEIKVSRGKFEQVIVEYADACAADLIVVGSPNQSWLDALLNKPVSRKVTNSAPCPVLVVPEAAKTV